MTNTAAINQFMALVEKETKQLADLEAQGALSQDPTWTIGLELEGWLLDSNLNPQPLAPKLVQELGKSEFSEELTKEIFEINLLPLEVGANCLALFDAHLTQQLERCRSWAEANGAQIVTIGMLPHLPPERFTAQLFTDSPRYQLLNDNLLTYRNNQPWAIKIDGVESMDVLCKDICLEALTTSAQFHLKVPCHQMALIYNLSQILAAPMAALGANARFLNGKNIWHETRIPLLQQSVSEQLPPHCWVNPEDRVLFGRQFVRKSILEIFQDNLRFTPLLPLLNEKSQNFAHLRIHNGTIWRWNRPIIGEEQGAYHVRLEHRVPSAGTSPSDLTAQLGFYLGFLAYCHYFEPEYIRCLTNQQARHNFYLAARYGFQSEVEWNNKTVNILELLRMELVPKAKKGLSALGLQSGEIAYYLDEILGERLKLGLSGSDWQVKQFKKYKNIKTVLEKYLEQQQSFQPLWRWD